MAEDHENDAGGITAWALVPYESAFSREWYIGGIGDLKFPFVVSGREAVVAAGVAMLCLLLIVLGLSLTMVGFVAMAGFFLPRLLRDRVFDGRSLQGYLGARMMLLLRRRLILPSGKRASRFYSETTT